MFAAPVIQRLTGDRLHLSHGPIDVVLKAWGAPDALRAAYDSAARRFPTILPDLFDTPMAAVAGAVADELLTHMTAAAPLERAFVNDGGDIAVLVSEGHALEVGVAGEFSRGDVPVLNGR